MCSSDLFGILIELDVYAYSHDTGTYFSYFRYFSYLAALHGGFLGPFSAPALCREDFVKAFSPIFWVKIMGGITSF